MNLNDILAGNTTTKRDKDVRVIDSDWVSSHFIVGNNTLSKLDQVNRFSTTAFLKFTNSSLGGNMGINPWPQITRFADAKPESDLARFRILQSLYKTYKKSYLQKYDNQYINFIDAIKLLNFWTTDYINYVDAILDILRKYVSNNA